MSLFLLGSHLPFSDLSRNKYRPALVLAEQDFDSGTLAHTSYVRPSQATRNDVQQPGYYAPPANNPQYPPGDVCTPNQTAPLLPPCPAGYTCTPDR